MSDDEAVLQIVCLQRDASKQMLGAIRQYAEMKGQTTEVLLLVAEYEHAVAHLDVAVNILNEIKKD